MTTGVSALYTCRSGRRLTVGPGHVRTGTQIARFGSTPGGYFGAYREHLGASPPRWTEPKASSTRIPEQIHQIVTGAVT